MSLITVIIVLVVVGVILYLINKYVPMDAKVKTILNWAIVIILIIWLLRAVGLFSNIHDVKI